MRGNPPPHVGGYGPSVGFTQALQAASVSLSPLVPRGERETGALLLLAVCARTFATTDIPAPRRSGVNAALPPRVVLETWRFP